MRAVVTAAVINDTDRTVDLTVRVYNDLNVLLQTEGILCPIDTISNEMVNDRLMDLMDYVRKQRAAIPYTQAQVTATYVDQTAILPD